LRNIEEAGREKNIGEDNDGEGKEDIVY